MKATVLRFRKDLSMQLRFFFVIHYLHTTRASYGRTKEGSGSFGLALLSDYNLRAPSIISTIPTLGPKVTGTYL